MDTGRQAVPEEGKRPEKKRKIEGLDELVGCHEDHGLAAVFDDCPEPSKYHPPVLQLFPDAGYSSPAS